MSVRSDTRQNRAVESTPGDAVASALSALRARLSAADIADGWTEKAQAGLADGLERVLTDLKFGWGPDADYASHHLVRIMDHWGIAAFSTGPMATLIDRAQLALIAARPAQ